ncbi:sacsin N-terminal ATP-binding-like domain-containing protein [Mesorhizobium kowhaii]|uniref:sacsin N-terminal ATP-binding-like domain-containing protein n=1 Tax=Mesorhizobium kowhaii TaxID=1300272 RepID=UPI0035E598E1
MNEFTVLPSPIAAESDADLGAQAARMIWDDQPGVDDLSDPRTPEFANAVVTGLASALASSPGALKKMMRGAAAAAEDLNVEPFQGLTEVIQNADDLCASEVRFAFRDTAAGRELLIVHNGHPVACQHVLGMALPFVTTKTNRTDQRGRFGIGLKTLKRIADDLAIHSSPYHFSGDQLSVQVVPAEGPLPGFYDPATDTMIVLRLKPDFSEEGLKAWFAEWEDDGLIFLTWVSSFRWCDLTGATMEGRTLTFGAWENIALVGGRASITALSRREVQSTAASWTVWRATLPVPGHLHPAHKARRGDANLHRRA